MLRNFFYVVNDQNYRPYKIGDREIPETNLSLNFSQFKFSRTIIDSISQLTALSSQLSVSQTEINLRSSVTSRGPGRKETSRIIEVAKLFKTLRNVLAEKTSEIGIHGALLSNPLLKYKLKIYNYISG